MVGIVHGRHRMIFPDVPVSPFDGNIYRYVRLNRGLLLSENEGIASAIPIHELSSLQLIPFDSSRWLV